MNWDSASVDKIDFASSHLSIQYPRGILYPSEKGTALIAYCTILNAIVSQFGRSQVIKVDGVATPEQFLDLRIVAAKISESSLKDTTVLLI